MSTVVDKSKVPWWVANLIVPFVNLILALLVSGLFIFIPAVLLSEVRTKGNGICNRDAHGYALVSDQPSTNTGILQTGDC